MPLLASQLPVVEVGRVYYKTALRNAAALGYPVLLLLKGNTKLSSSLRNLPFCLQGSVTSLCSFAPLVRSLSSLSWLAAQRGEPPWSQGTMEVPGKGLGLVGFDGSWLWTCLPWQTALRWPLTSSLRSWQLMFLWQFSSLSPSPLCWCWWVVQGAKPAENHRCYCGADLASCQFSLPGQVFGIRCPPVQGG